jgi:ribonuclease D
MGYHLQPTFKSTKGKSGKAPLVQISYRLPDQDETHAFLLRLEKTWKEVPLHLHQFLVNKQHTFVGVSVRQDVKMLMSDYSSEPDVKNVQVIELGRYAKNRDVVNNANTSLADLVEKLLGVKMNKQNDIRCSRWSNKPLTAEQMLYASEDAIKSLDVYMKLCGMKDLSQRLSDVDAQEEGIEVDIVPPHSRSNPNRILSGYGKDINRMTRGAIGEICSPNGLVTLAPQIHPSRSGRHHIGTVIVLQ